MTGPEEPGAEGVTLTIAFYDVHALPHGALSNFSKHPFTLGGLWYPTAEHAFQAAKFVGTPQAETIRRIRGAKDAARMARDCRSLVRSDWDQVKDDVMRRVLAAKFAEHEPLRRSCSRPASSPDRVRLADGRLLGHRAATGRA